MLSDNFVVITGEALTLGSGNNLGIERDTPVVGNWPICWGLAQIREGVDSCAELENEPETPALLSRSPTNNMGDFWGATHGSPKEIGVK